MKKYQRKETEIVSAIKIEVGNKAVIGEIMGKELTAIEHEFHIGDYLVKKNKGFILIHGAHFEKTYQPVEE